MLSYPLLSLPLYFPPSEHHMLFVDCSRTAVQVQSALPQKPSVESELHAEYGIAVSNGIRPARWCE